MFRVFMLLMLVGVIFIEAAEDTHTEIEERDNDRRKLEDLLVIKELATLLGLTLKSKDADDLADMTPGEIKEMKTDDFFGDDGPEPLEELFERMAHEWEKLIRLQDPDAIANKYTEDCVNVYRKDGETRVVVGREEAKKLYETWFEEDGVKSLKVEPSSRKGGHLGSEYLWLVNHVLLFDENEDKIKGITNVLVFKHISHKNAKGGFEIMLVAEIRD